MDYPNQQQWAIILETISFGLVTLDLYGEERLTELTEQIQKTIHQTIINIKNTRPFTTISQKTNFVFRCFEHIWKWVSSIPMKAYNVLRRLINLKPVEYAELTQSEIEDIEKLISLILSVFFISAILLIGLGIYCLSNLYALNFLFALVCFYILVGFGFLIAYLLKKYSHDEYDTVDDMNKLALVPVLIFGIIFGIFYLFVFLLYYYAVPYLIVLPLLIVAKILEFSLYLFSKLQLKNIMLLVGSILFILSKYLSYISSFEAL